MKLPLIPSPTRPKPLTPAGMDKHLRQLNDYAEDAVFTETMNAIAELISTTVSKPHPATQAEAKIVLSGLAIGHIRAAMAAHAALRAIDPMVAEPVMKQIRKQVDKLEHVAMDIQVSGEKCTCGKCHQPKTHRN